MENNLQDIFVPYEESRELKQLGFNEPTLYHWHNSEKNYPLTNEIYFPGCQPYTNSGIKNIGNENHTWSAPTWEQAFKFFRDKYNLYTGADYWRVDSSIAFKIWIKGGYHSMTDYFDTYEEARLKCLKQLIKIVKDAK